MEEFYYEESNPKHVFIKCLIFLFLIGVGIGVFLFYRKENTIKLKNITIEVGSTLSNDVNDYLVSGKKNSDEYKLILKGVDTKVVGKYTYKVKYNKHTKKGTINVIDTKPPLVTTEDIVVGVDEKYSPNILVTSCVDYSLPCKVSIKNDEDLELLKKAGTYNVEIIVSDAEGNVVNKEVNITVSETESMSSRMTNDLNYYTNSENDDTIEHDLFIKLDKAINEDSLEFEGLVQELSAEDFSIYTEEDIYSTKLITAYNKYGYVVGLQVLVTFYDGTNKLLVK